MTGAISRRSAGRRCLQRRTDGVFLPCCRSAESRQQKPRFRGVFVFVCGLEKRCLRTFCLVPRRGLEPPRFYPLVPETSASTNSATWAGGRVWCVAARTMSTVCRPNFFAFPLMAGAAATGTLLGSWRVRGDLPHRGCGRILAANVKNHQENWPSRHARLRWRFPQTRFPYRSAQRRVGHTG